MSGPDRAVAPQDLLTKTQVKEEFCLTDSQVTQIGEPDATRPNPHYRSGAPLRLYSRERVARWIAEHQHCRSQAEPRRKAALKAAKTKRVQTRKKLAALLRKLEMHPAPCRKRKTGEVCLFLLDRYGDGSGEVSERALCSYLRHHYTNYEAILDSVRGMVGVREFYPAVKLCLCCQIIRRYRLNLDPLVAAFGSRKEAPDCFQVADPERVAAQVLGLVAEVGEQE